MTQNVIRQICFIFSLFFSFSFISAQEKNTSATNLNVDAEQEYIVTLEPGKVRGRVIGSFLGGSIKVDGAKCNIFIPEKGPYALKKTNESLAIRVYVDYNRNGKIGNDEVWAADYPIRFGDKMLAVKSIAADGSKMVLIETDTPVKGLVIGQRAPDFELTDMDGKKHTLTDYQGKFLLIDIWSQSCKPCIKKMPDIRELQKKLGTDKLDVLLLSMDDGREGSKQRNRTILKDMDLPWPNVMMPNSWKHLAELFNAHGFGLWFISPEGKLLVADGKMKEIQTAIDDAAYASHLEERRKEKKKRDQIWHLGSLDTDSVYGTGVIKAYNELLKGKTPKAVTVAILDGGIDTLHEDLRANLWHNQKELPGNADVDGNGYKGDAQGWNFLGGPDGQVTTDSYEYQRVYFRYKEQFENITDEKQVKKKDLQNYRLWVLSKTLLKQAETPALFVYSRYKDKFENITDEKQVKNDDLQLYRVWLISKRELKNPYTVAPVDYRGEFVKDNYFDIRDRFYGNADLMGAGYFHGTHVGGIVGAVRDNGIGVDGIANAVQLMGIRVVANGDEHDKDVALGIRYAVDNGAQIINMSFGKKISPERKMVEDAIRYAEKKGVLLIAAAGNDGTDIDEVPHYPTPFYSKGGKRASNMIKVGASGSTEAMLVAPFTNFGKTTVDVFAPGDHIYSTTRESNYGPMSGTSMAAPVVTGIAALIKNYYPDLTAQQIKFIIEESVTKIDFPVTKPRSNGQKVAMKDLCRTGGIVNAYNALVLAEKMSKTK